MRRALLLAAILASGPAAAAPPPLPAGQHWTAVPELTDEFDGPLDTGKWSQKHPYWTGRGVSEFRPENVSASGGFLRLAASRIDHDGKTIGAACLSSRNAIAGPGYYEARLKASQISLSSSFWLQNPKIEIDVVEAFGVPMSHPARRFEARATLHAFPNGWNSDIGIGKSAKLKAPVTAWHTYGVWWRDAGSVWVYVDGVKVSEIETPRPFTSPMYVFFDTEHFDAEGTPNSRDLADLRRNTMLVDWVRAYSLQPKPAAERRGSPSP